MANDEAPAGKGGGHKVSGDADPLIVPRPRLDDPMRLSDVLSETFGPIGGAS